MADPGRAVPPPGLARSDRFDNRWLLFCYHGLRGLSLPYLPFSDCSLYSLSILAVLYGLDWVATVPPMVKLTAQRFGPETANIVFGWIFAGHQPGAASAALAGGVSRTVWPSYLPAFIGAGLLCLIGAGLVCSSIAEGRRRSHPLEPGGGAASLAG